MPSRIWSLVRRLKAPIPMVSALSLRSLLPSNVPQNIVYSPSDQSVSTSAALTATCLATPMSSQNNDTGPKSVYHTTQHQFQPVPLRQTKAKSKLPVLPLQDGFETSRPVATVTQSHFRAQRAQSHAPPLERPPPVSVPAGLWCAQAERPPGSLKCCKAPQGRIHRQRRKPTSGEVGFSCSSPQTGGCPVQDNLMVARETQSWIGIR